MKPREFDSLIAQHVAPVVEPWGFTCADGKGCTFRRRVSDELYHFIMFDIKRNGYEFEVMVFPATPRLGPERWAGYPDFVGIPTGAAAGLNAKTGVGGGTSRFSCKDSATLEVALTRAVLPALEFHARTYLEKFATLADIVPYLEHPQWAALLK